MNLVLRLLYVTLRLTRGPRLGPLDESVVPFRVLPNDLDYNRHVNNGRYFALMDLGRYDLMMRVGLVRAMLRRRWNPVVASVTMRFRRPLNAFQGFELRTRIVGWDDRWLYLEQRFTREGEVIAAAVVKGAILGPAGRVAPGELAALAGHPPASPPLPPGVREWVDAEEEMHAPPREMEVA